MIKDTQTIRQKIADELFDCVWPFCEIDAKRVNQQVYNKIVVHYGRFLVKFLEIFKRSILWSTSKKLFLS